MPSRRRAFFWGIALGVVALFSVLTASGWVRDTLLPGPAETRSDQARQIIEDSYFREAGSEELDNGSIAGMVCEIRKASDDKFSHYFDPKTFERFNQATSGQFSGVGLAVSEVPTGCASPRCIPTHRRRGPESRSATRSSRSRASRSPACRRPRPRPGSRARPGRR